MVENYQTIFGYKCHPIQRLSLEFIYAPTFFSIHAWVDLVTMRLYEVYLEESGSVPAIDVHRPKFFIETGLIVRQSFMKVRLCTWF